MGDQGLGARLREVLGRHGVVRAPSLQTDEDRTASRLELFFDLAFVLVVTQLATALREHLSLGSAGVFAGLFAVLWWSWASSTLYANRFDHDDAVYRLLKLAGMAAVIGMAAAAPEATGARFVPFAACALAMRALLLLQYLRADRSVHEARPVVRRYAATLAAGAVLWAVSLAVPRPVGFVLWGLAVVVEALGPLLATGSDVDLPLHLEHLPERFALFVILVLGESVAAVTNGVIAAGWAGRAVAVAAVCFGLAAALWWSYFDLAGAGAKRLLDQVGGARAHRVHDVYVFGQLPLCLGLAAVGAGIELAVEEGGQGEVPPGTRLLIAGGVALYLAAVSLTNTGMAQSRRSGWWWPLAAAVVAGLDALLELPALVVVGALAVLVAVVVVVGTVQRATGRLRVEPL